MGYKRRNLADFRATDIGPGRRDAWGSSDSCPPDRSPRTTPEWRVCRVWVVAAALLLSGLACGRNIGDSCSSSSDCDPTRGTRTCDLSQPGGYCLVEGCDARSCPSNSICIRAFPGAFLEKMCSADMPCATDEICLSQAGQSGADGGTGPSYCARLSLEKRLCLQTCGGNGDCRGGYVCSAIGAAGTLALTLSAESTAQARFCEPAR
jgi:hypothetical protein